MQSARLDRDLLLRVLAQTGDILVTGRLPSGTLGMNFPFGEAGWSAQALCGRPGYLPGQDAWGKFDAAHCVRLQRVPDMTEQGNEAGSTNLPSMANQDAAAAAGTRSAETLPTMRRMPPEAWKAGPKRKLLAAVLGVAVLAGLLVTGLPWIREMLNTVSTDDAFVNGHVTFVAPRVGGQVSRVLVDDNNRVHKGDLLAELDKEPYRIAVSGKQAAVDTAKADLQAATAAVRAVEAQARSRRWNLQRSVQDVEGQVALLHARIAAVNKGKAALALAQVEFDRAQQLVGRADVPRAVYDERQAEVTKAGADLAQTLAEVHQIRVSLGLPAQPEGGGDLGQVPPDLDETFSAVLQAQAELIQSAAQLGIVHAFGQSPKAMLDEFESLGDIDRTFARFTANAPAVKQAEAKLEAARRDLAQAELDLRYCDITAELDGVVTRRNVNAGNYVQVGQNLMAIRSLDEIWVDANFKETQLRDLRIGQPVELRTDMYGGTHIFKGRVSGFTMGTGSTLALLPPQNATGNFVKVVQRLPVRIELVDYHADRTPLFIGTSVVPSVHINEPPTGPDAGKFLQAFSARSPGGGPAAGGADPGK
ncbi:HlyD family secretion protein [Rhodovastum atsumiense]|uniref:HlyD family secretion protein n=1 Tax=Rhodovastum atsumiense TaxID=504468 RepID=UPI00193BE8CA|nr:HlyD family secretion protein [Rhodovastum atsumiense]